MTYVFIALFAILAAFARYGQTVIVQAWAGRDFPWATLSINVFGSFLMGYLFYATLASAMAPALRTGILIGGLGTYTTFSTFSLETLNLIEEGESRKGLLYITSSVGLSLIAVVLGAALSRSIGV